jgi:hypothetical protein
VQDLFSLTLSLGGVKVPIRISAKEIWNYYVLCAFWGFLCFGTAATTVNKNLVVLKFHTPVVT